MMTSSTPAHYKMANTKCPNVYSPVLKIENFHRTVKILGNVTKPNGTFSGRKLLADFKNVHVYKR
jgi:hypothetical protein